MPTSTLSIDSAFVPANSTQPSYTSPVPAPIASQTVTQYLATTLVLPASGASVALPVPSGWTSVQQCVVINTDTVSYAALSMGNSSGSYGVAFGSYQPAPTDNGPQAAYLFNALAQPNDSDTAIFTFPSGPARTLTAKAAAPSAPAGEFLIGATLADTYANMATLMQSQYPSSFPRAVAITDYVAFDSTGTPAGSPSVSGTWAAISITPQTIGVNGQVYTLVYGTPAAYQFNYDYNSGFDDFVANLGAAIALNLPTGVTAASVASDSKSIILTASVEPVLESAPSKTTLLAYPAVQSLTPAQTVSLAPNGGCVAMSFGGSTLSGVPANPTLWSLVATDVNGNSGSNSCNVYVYLAWS